MQHLTQWQRLADMLPQEMPYSDQSGAGIKQTRLQEEHVKIIDTQVQNSSYGFTQISEIMRLEFKRDVNAAIYATNCSVIQKRFSRGLLVFSQSISAYNLTDCTCKSSCSI